MYRSFLKRYIDFFAALLLLVIFSPVIIVIACILAWVNKGKAFFRQQRPGKNEQPIYIIKFKSMTDAKDANGNLLPDNKRITRAGAFVRKYSLDELPQFINVLKGDMSLVGPRPLLYKYIPLYNAEQKRRHLVKPGITGWAQVNGRNSISWQQKFSLDVYYVDHFNFWLDVKILWLTFLKVIKKEGVNQSDERPMMPFDGNN
ncbi:MAG TPA: sugar transferase [Ferruginibacter sp.]|nr:sugar transferase [Ferruginibacter sp.]HPH90290.1 sugar transferase [Ferruginibacter sp.]